MSFRALDLRHSSFFLRSIILLSSFRSLLSEKPLHTLGSEHTGILELRGCSGVFFFFNSFYERLNLFLDWGKPAGSDPQDATAYVTSVRGSIGVHRGRCGPLVSWHWLSTLPLGTLPRRVPRADSRDLIPRKGYRAALPAVAMVRCHAGGSATAVPHCSALVHWRTMAVPVDSEYST